MNPGSLLKIIEFNQYNFGDVLSYIFVYLAILWLLFCLWVLRDITNRTNNIFLIVFSVVFVFFFNIPGLLIYLMLRPEKTIEEARALDLYQISQLEDNLTTCRECRTIIRKNLSYCTACGTNLYISCEYCGKQVNPIWVNCGYCGQSLHLSSNEQMAYNMSKTNLKLAIVKINVGRRLSFLTTRIANLFTSLRRLPSKIHFSRPSLPKFKMPEFSVAVKTTDGSQLNLAGQDADMQENDSKKKEKNDTGIVTAKNNFFLPA